MDNKGRKCDIDKFIDMLESRVRIINARIQALLDERYTIEEDLKGLYEKKNKDGQ